MAGDLKHVLESPKSKGALSDADRELITRFVEKPEDFIPRHLGGLTLTQVNQNPFGDYAPQSGQIQGILKGLYDTFAAKLEKINVKEANAQKDYEALMATKKKE